MTTNFKADVRARMAATGEKYTEARRALVAERNGPAEGLGGVERVTLHPTQNGFPLADANCVALTKGGPTVSQPVCLRPVLAGRASRVFLSDSHAGRIGLRIHLRWRLCHFRADELTHLNAEPVTGR
jgi:hypothetical protein